ncbi:MAG: DUF5115 domain-containing protein [Bacteroidaceae bacterium]|nr:DUF5115 domain-containing protein [Bacteroidaceae bacterium]
MKKIYIFASLLTASLAFTACDEDYTDWADPQTYSQEDEQASIKGTIERISDNIDLSSADENINLIKLTGAENTTTNSNVKFTKLLLNGTTEIPVSTNEDTLVVKAQDLATALQTYYNSLECTTRTCEFSVGAVMVNQDGMASTMNFDSNNISINVQTAKLPSIADEEEFYYVGGYNSWKLASPTAMTANGDGTYSCILELAAGSEWFCFAPKSSVESQSWNALFRANSNGDTSTSGFFNQDITSGNSFCAEIAEAGKYKFTISPKTWTYSYAKYVESAFYAGDANGWSFSPLAKTGDSFVGYYYIYKPDNSSTWGFKVTSAANWDGAQYGAGATAGTIADGGGNIQITEESGFYKLSVNTDALTYTIEPISQMSLIGSAVNGDSNWGTDYDLTFNTETMAWEGTYEMTDGEYKIRANHDWTLSWGGALDAMTSQNGANLSITAGTYKFSFKPNCDGQGVLSVTAQ